MSAHDILAPVREIVRKHSPLPSVDILLDMGEFSEVTATVTYEAIPSEPRDRDQPKRPAYVIVYSVTVNGVDLMPIIGHPDTLRGIEGKVADTLRGER